MTPWFPLPSGSVPISVGRSLDHPTGQPPVAALWRIGCRAWRFSSLDLGLLLSLYTGYRIALTQSPRLSQALWALAPWALLQILLFAPGIWLVFQPMEMRGTFAG